MFNYFVSQVNFTSVPYTCSFVIGFTLIEVEVTMFNNTIWETYREPTMLSAEGLEKSIDKEEKIRKRKELQTLARKETLESWGCARIRACTSKQREGIKYIRFKEMSAHQF